MNIITIANQKGGVGKTTTAICLAFALGRYKRRILLVDLDQQCNASYLLKSEDDFTNIYDVLIENKDINKAIQSRSDVECLHFISASNKLSLADFDLKNLKKSEFLLKNSLNKLKIEYDYIIIDTPPSLNTLTVNAFIASNYIIIPTRADVLSLQGIGQLYYAFNTIKQKRNPDLKILGILVTHYESRSNITKKIVETLDETARRFDTKIMSYLIRDGAKIRECQALQENIIKFQNSVGVVEYFLTAKEIMLELEK